MDQPNRKFDINTPPRVDNCAGKVDPRLQRFTQQVGLWIRNFANPWLKDIQGVVGSGLSGVENDWVDATNSAGMVVDARHKDAQALSHTLTIGGADAWIEGIETVEFDAKGHKRGLANLAAGITHADPQAEDADKHFEAFAWVDAENTGNPFILFYNKVGTFDAKGHRRDKSFDALETLAPVSLRFNGDDHISVIGTPYQPGPPEVEPAITFTHQSKGSTVATRTVGGVTFDIDAKGHLAMSGTAGDGSGAGGGFDVSVDWWGNWTKNIAAADPAEAFETTTDADFEISSQDWRGRMVHVAMANDIDGTSGVVPAVTHVEATPASDVDLVLSGEFRVMVNSSNGHLYVRRTDTTGAPVFVRVQAFAGPKKTSVDATV